MTSTTMSTYSSYLIVNRDMKSSLDRIAAQGEVSRDTKYYEENIGKVQTVDEFVDDYKLYSYAMKAYGLEDMTYAKAFMKKVLNSDLTDSSSFANSLSDTRYKNFAAAFNFGSSTATAQTSTQEDNLVGAYQDSFDEEETTIQSAVDNYNNSIDSITSVDDLLADDDLKNYVLNAFGFDTTYTSDSYLKQVLTSDPDDADSYANQTGNDNAIALAKAFNFDADGNVDGDSVQTDDQKQSLQLDYIYNMSTYPSDLLEDANKTYWDSKIATITNVDDLVNDNRMVEYLSTAYNINVSFTSTIKSILTSDSSAEIMGYTNVKAMFNFQSDGTLADGTTAQTDDQLASTDDAYALAFQADQEDTVDNAVSNYKTRIADVKTIDDFLTSNADDDSNSNDDVTEIWDVALRAYGIDPDSVTKAQIEKVLSSDLDDPKSYANQQDDDRYVELAKAFNFDAEGDIKTPLLAQSTDVSDDIATDYVSQKVKFLTGKARETAESDANDEADYYQKQMESITTVKQFLADDRLVSFVLEAKGIDPDTVDSADLKKMFASDLDDPKSYVNSLEDNSYAEIVASFNFDSDGNLSSDPVGSVQQRGDTLATVNNYLQQTLETQEGETNQGVRLALYFERNAADITSAYSILGDTALFSFFKTTFSLSDYISNMDTDKQADLVKQYVDLDKLQDPDYVSTLIKRFSALYDSANNTSTSGALTILTGTGSSGISADTMLAIAQLSSK